MYSRVFIAHNSIQYNVGDLGLFLDGACTSSKGGRGGPRKREMGALITIIINIIYAMYTCTQTYYNVNGALLCCVIPTDHTTDIQ